MAISSTKWRINVSENWGGTNLTITEVEMMTSIGGTDECTGGTASAINEWSAGHVAAYAFDDSTSTVWSPSAANQTTGWIQYEFSSAKTIQQYTIVGAQGGFYANSPKSWKLQAEVGGTWVDVHSVTNTPAWANDTIGEKRYFINGGKYFQPYMTAASTPSPNVVTVSSTYSAPDYDGWQTFRDGTNHYWVDKDGVSPSCWLKLNLGSGNTKTLKSYMLQMNVVPEATRAPQDWTLQGSNNDSDWDTLDTVTGQTSWGSGELRYFTCDTATTAYQYFKINITANNGDGTYTQINNMFLFESESPWATGDTPFRLRMLIDATGDPTSKQFQLEYRHKPSGGSFGAWNKVK